MSRGVIVAENAFFFAGFIGSVLAITWGISSKK
jgi:hypothetical protein